MRELKKYEGNRVILMACSKCNVACKHCYIGYTGNRTPEELEELAKFYSERYKIVRIDGAEPLVDLGYLSSYKIVGQDWIMTNGLRIFKEPEIIDLLKSSGIKTVFMSYHFGIQDSLNGITNEMLNEVIRKLKEKDLRVVLMTTITNKNAKDTFNICDTAYELGASGIEFNKIFIQGRAKNLTDIGLNLVDYNDFFSQIKKAREKYNINELEVRRSGTFGVDTVYEPNRFQCSAGVKKVCITPDNKVYGCTCICKPGYEVGEIIDKEIYLYKDFYNDRSWCLGDKMGELGIDNIQELNNPNIKKLIKKIN
ncbi:MAG: radical SAM protein [Firmicutes bacterium]|nr:radical SAM protein [Bacillota bacterium]